jgi:tRNA-binding EMAP/Myf-like protein
VEIPFEEFQKLDLRIGKIIEANQIPGSRNLGFCNGTRLKS